jgi:hypothetical protein
MFLHLWVQSNQQVQKKYKKHMKKNLQEEVSRIKDMMNKLNERMYDNDSFDTGNDSFDTDDDDDSFDRDDESSKWKTSDDIEDEGPTDIKNLTLDDIKNKVEKELIKNGKRNVDVTYLGKSISKGIDRKTNKERDYKVDVVTVTIVLDEGNVGEDEFLSFDVIKGWKRDVAFNTYYLRPTNMVYHNNGEEIKIEREPHGIYNKDGGDYLHYPIYDTVSKFINLDTIIMKTIMGSKKHEETVYESENNKNYWENWDEDSDSGDEDIEHMRLIVRNMVDKGKIDDNEGYEMENILDTELEAYAEYNSGPQGSIDYKATLKNIRRYLNQREPDDNQMNNNFNHEGGIRFNRDEDNWQGR